MQNPKIYLQGGRVLEITEEEKEQLVGFFQDQEYFENKLVIAKDSQGQTHYFFQSMIIEITA